jgi:hypothetical protein
MLVISLLRESVIHLHVQTGAPTQCCSWMFTFLTAVEAPDIKTLRCAADTAARVLVLNGRFVFRHFTPIATGPSVQLEAGGTFLAG